MERAQTPLIDWMMPADEYHALAALGSSDVKAILRSPAHFKARANADDEPTEAKEIGTALHMAVFEPARFASEVVASPTFDRRTKAGKADAEAFEAAHAGKLILSASNHLIVQHASASVRAHRGAAALLAAGQPEVTFQWTDTTSGAPCKARVDWLRPDGVLVDLKSTRDASPAGFVREIVRFGYHLQAAHYMAGARAVLQEPPQAFVLIAVEKEPPFACGVYVLDDDARVRAAGRVAAALARWAECNAAGSWPAYSDLIEPITLPAWA